MAGQRQVTKSFATRAAAKSWARDLEAKLAKGELRGLRGRAAHPGRCLHPVPRDAPGHRVRPQADRELVEGHPRSQDAGEGDEPLANRNPRRPRGRFLQGRAGGRPDRAEAEAGDGESLDHLPAHGPVLLRRNRLDAPQPGGQETARGKARPVPVRRRAEGAHEGAGGVRGASDAALRLLRDFVRCAGWRAPEPRMEGRRPREGRRDDPQKQEQRRAEALLPGQGARIA